MDDNDKPVTTALPPGVCIDWEQKRKELGDIVGDEELIRRVWQDIDGLAYIYIWHCLLSF